MNLVLRGLTWTIVLAFLEENGLILKPRKGLLFQGKVEFLGRTVSENGLEVEQQHLKPVQDWKVSINTKKVEQFLVLSTTIDCLSTTMLLCMKIQGKYFHGTMSVN